MSRVPSKFLVDGTNIVAKGVVYSDANKAIKSTALTNGQLLIGSTGNNAVASTITAGSGISVTNGAGSITVAATGAATPNSEVWVQEGNMWGSTNTYVRIFSNVITNVGSDITYATDASLGDSFTINATGIYAVSYWDVFTSGEYIGVVLNGTQPTVQLTSLTTITEAITLCCTPSGNDAGLCSTVLHLTSGDVLWAQTDAATQAGVNKLTAFRITRVG